MRAFGTSAVPFLVVFVYAIVTAGSAAGQSRALGGTYELEQQNSDDVNAAIRDATEGAGFFVRSVGRRLLAEKLRPIPLLRIAVTDSTAAITGEDGSSLVTPPAATRWDGTALVQVFREDDGVRQYRYSLDRDGRTLRVEVRVEGTRLPRPVEYTLTYGRMSPGPP